MCKKALFWFALAATLVVTTASSAFSAWLAKDFDIEGQVFPEDMLFQAAVSLTLFHDEDQAKSDPVLFSLWLGADISSLTDEDGRELEFEGPYTEGERGFDVFHMKVYLKEPLSPQEEERLTFRYRAIFDGVVSNHISPINSYQLQESYWYPKVGEVFAGGELNLGPVQMSITVPSDQTVVSEGELLEVIDGEETKTYVWWSDRHPFGFMSAVYKKVREMVEGIEFTAWVFPRYEGAVSALQEVIVDAMKFFSEAFLPYPDARFSVAQVKRRGGYGSMPLLLNEEYFKGVLVQRDIDLLSHEAAHRWWGGGLVQTATLKDRWLSEGFAQYSSLLYVGHSLGRERMLEKLRENVQGYLGLDPSEDVPMNSGQWGGSAVDILYHKGSYVLHMLRFVLGDDLFFDTMRAFAQEHYNGLASIDDFQDVAERVGGEDLDWFFDEWIRGTGVPSYRVQDFYMVGDNGAWSAKVRAFQDSTFDMPVEVTFLTEGGDMTGRMRVDSTVSEHIFPLGSRPLSFSFDQDDWILKRDLVYQFPIKSLQAEPSDGGILLSWEKSEGG